jgi:hypothetical protein
MERITARWPDGRSVTYWDREVTGDQGIVTELNQRSRITGDRPSQTADWRRNGISFMAASSAVRAPELPVFESQGVSVPI